MLKVPSAGYADAMLEISWATVLVYALPFIGGALMFFIRTNPADVDRNISGWRNWLRVRRWPFFIFGFLLTAIGIGVGIAVTPYLEKPSIYPLFAQTYNLNRKNLGAPLSEAINARAVAQSLFSNAWLVWLDFPGKLYAIPRYDESNRSVLDVDDKSFGQNWTFDDSKIRSRPSFKNIAQSCKLPFGGFAQNWDARPELWSWVGCGEWYCIVNSDPVFSQNFENGQIIGPLRVGRDEDAAQIFILFNDGKNKAVRATGPVPKVVSCQF